PLVGTFYRAAQPGGKAFVEVGDHVEPGTQVAVVEAMKLMNPVEADRAGRVTEFLSLDGAAVEYGQPLIAIVPSA
ncbi:MAG: acetyl-CoA carboxylase biotin carboxyl carrier protein, partial [Pseudonocardiaceae bacterium]